VPSGSSEISESSRKKLSFSRTRKTLVTSYALGEDGRGLKMELTPAQTLAGWIIFTQKAGEHGPLFPPREVLEKIVQRQEGRYAEAEALAERFVEKLLSSEPKTAVDTGVAAMRFVKGVDNLLGGMFSTPPMLGGKGK
jgi:hypothetical protein